MPKRKKSQRRTQKRQSFRSRFRGSGNLYVVLILGFVVVLSALITSGLSPLHPSSLPPPDPANQVVIVTPSIDPEPSKPTLQLQTLSFRGRECLRTVAVDLLVDRTGSMVQQTATRQRKIDALKGALTAFVNQLSDDSIIGMHSFASDPLPREDVAITYYRNNKTQMQNAITSLSPSGETPMRAGMNLSRIALQSAVAQFPTYQFTLIMLSDGAPVPNTAENDPLTAPNVAQAIKDSGVTIFTIGIIGAGNTPENENRLRAIATSPSHYYRSPTGDDLTQIYSQIGQQLCR